MITRNQSIEAEPGRVPGSILTPLRWVLLLGIAAALPLPWGREIPTHRAALLAAVAICMSLALIYAAGLLGTRDGRGLAGGAIALVLASQIAFSGDRAKLLDIPFAIARLSFLPLVVLAAGWLAQEVREREVVLRRTERRALTLEAQEERVRQDMEVARHVQESLLPAPRWTSSGLTVATLFCPARAVGGDIYDLIELPDGQFLVAIADVCGHGMPAALLSVAVQQRIRQFAQPDPAAVLAGVNQMLLEKAPEDMFVTAACVVIDPRDGSAVAAVAGHPAPLRWANDRGRLLAVRGHGPALGLSPDWTGPTEQWLLAPSDVLILYTDGVEDAKLTQEERLGEQRLVELLGRTPPVDAAEWVERLRRTLDSCVEQPDDVTILAIGREPSLTAASSGSPSVDGQGGAVSESDVRGRSRSLETPIVQAAGVLA